MSAAAPGTGGLTAEPSVSAGARVRAAYARIAAIDRPELWITLRPPEDVLAEAEILDAGPPLPLGGALLAVKDNIDVAGLATTAGCPAYAYEPMTDAPGVARLRAAGALVLGKTNLDQFATGLVGTRSPYGVVRDARRPEYVSGGSSSGSAVAVALGIVDLALGTDTAGSGRVPAAFQGLVGVKPTRGLVSVAGVVPACRTLDCVTVLARDVAAAERALWVMAGPTAGGPTAAGGTAEGPAAAGDAAAALDRGWPPDAALAAPPAPRIGVPAAGRLDGELSPDARRAFAAAVERLAALGAALVEVDLDPFLKASELLYGGAFVAERHAAVGAFVDAQADAVDPTVRAIIQAAGRLTASQLVRDAETLDALRAATAPALAATDALLLPTVPRQPTIAEVAAGPVAVNTELGRFTSFVNLLDLCAIAMPAGEADGGHFGVSFVAPAFCDLVLADLARRFLAEPPALPTPGEPAGIPLLVVGAHRRGQPLHHQLTSLGARGLGIVRTEPTYRMHALATEPPKPGLVRVREDGVAVEGELWALPPAQLGPFLAALPEPMALGQVTLENGRDVVGFLCEPAALDGAPDISEHGSWPAYLAVTRGPS